ncbi:MAG: PEP-CTERM sorting domain-containing protein [Chthonomonas sp.]|nr:PEP-CTERM sorting domain-containing protein [Chthonomonas sp.]
MKLSRLIIIGTLSLALLPEITLGQRQFRYFLTYQDSQLVQLARGSGYDPDAELGAEIPSNVPLSVPSMSSFTVGLSMQYVANGFGSLFLKGFRNYVVYDRANGDNGAYLSAVPLDEHSFRKVSPVYTGISQLSQNLSNFGSGVVYDLHGNTVDINGDGMPDVATYSGSVARGVGAYVAGNDNAVQIRGVGTSYFMTPDYDLMNGFIGSGWFKILPGATLHFCNATYTNTLGIGETYGNGGGETGLHLYTTGGEQTGYANNMGFLRNVDDYPEAWQNIGAKYTLIGAAPVPEPGVMVGLLAGLAMLIRRRR